MSAQADPYLSAYLRKPRIPDTAVVPGSGDQSKTLLPPRRRPRVPRDLDAGPLEAEVGSFALHMAAEGKGPAHDRELHRGGPLVRRRRHPDRDR
jgi:hypothetical protein